MKQTATLGILAAMVALWPAFAPAQQFPTRPMRLVVAFQPGGGTDIVSRMVATRLGAALGQQVVVDNRPGADGLIGTELAARATPDGYAMFVGTCGNLAINPSLYPNAPFKIARDFAPVTQLVTVDMMLTVYPTLPVKSVKDLVALAKAKPGQLIFASTGTGGIPHLAMELLNHLAGTTMVHVPYKGGSPALVALTGGHVPMLVQSMVQGLRVVQAGKLRAIAILSPKRNPLLPDLPTVAETLPGFDATNWFGMMVPAKTPAAIHKRITSEVVRLLHSGELRKQLVARGAEPVGNTPKQFAAFLKSETAKWARVIEEAKIKR